MALSIADITRLNPWWDDPSWEQRDPYLSAVPAAAALPTPGFVEGISPGDKSVHVVRGPRQVGKSTGLKMLSLKALQDGVPSSQVIYLNLDLLEGTPIADFAATVRRAKQLAAGDGPTLLLLDEVTVIPKYGVSRWLQ